MPKMQIRNKALIGWAASLLAAFLFIVVMSPRTALADEGSLRIHVLSFSSYQDAIVLECDGHFGMVDSGEDNDYPCGDDVRYPYRPKTTIGQGHEDEAIAYLANLGVTPDNFEFYIGTHSHSDHIGSADEVIRAFCPERVYTPDYKDEYINDSAFLWDNLYVYDHMREAAEEVGAPFITKRAYDAPVYPEADGAASPVFSLGSAQIEIVNWENHELTAGAYRDANDYCWGVLVSCGGKRAFLAGDINNYRGDEDVLGAALGRVDVLKLAHHGCVGSNSQGFLAALQPTYAVVTAPFRFMPDDTVDTLLSLGTHIYCAPESASEGKDAIVITLSGDGVWVDALADPSQLTFRANCGSHDAVAFMDGAPASYSGVWTTDVGLSYRFDGSPYGTLVGSSEADKGKWVHDKYGWWWKDSDGSYPVSMWKTINGVQYYFDSRGYMATGWVKYEGRWYYLDASGALATGWRKVQGSWYYLDPAVGGAMATGLFTVGSTRYAAYTYGLCPVSNWVQVGKNWYLTSSSCAVRTGWAKHGSSWYWLDTSTGAMVTGWQKSGNTWYYLKPSGAMATGWAKVGGKWYWFNASGAMATGWKKIGSSWYWFDASGAMLADAWTPDGYYVNKSGAWVKGKVR